MTQQSMLWWLYLKAKRDVILELIDRAYSLLIHSLETADSELSSAMLDEVEDVLMRASNHYSILQDFFTELELTEMLQERLKEVVEDYHRVKALFPYLYGGGESDDVYDYATDSLYEVYERA